MYKEDLIYIEDVAYVINLNEKKVKEYIWFHYSFTEIQQCTLIYLGFNMFYNISIKQNQRQIHHSQFF